MTAVPRTLSIRPRRRVRPTGYNGAFATQGPDAGRGPHRQAAARWPHTHFIRFPTIPS